MRGDLRHIKQREQGEHRRAVKDDLCWWKQLHDRVL